MVDEKDRFGETMKVLNVGRTLAQVRHGKG